MEVQCPKHGESMEDSIFRGGATIVMHRGMSMLDVQAVWRGRNESIFDEGELVVTRVGIVYVCSSMYVGVSGDA